MSPNKRRILLASIFGLPLALFLTVLLYELAHPTLPPLPALPNPNGYDNFVKAGEMVSTNSWNYDSATLTELQETVTANAAALVLARTGLTNDCRVPEQFTQAYLESHVTDLIAVKRLAQAWVTAGRLAEMENQPAAAAKSYLDVIHFGLESARGGALIDQMVGIAIEAIGTSHLRAVVDQLDGPACRETAAALETLDVQRPTWDQVMQQENDWSRRTFTSIRYEIMRLLTRRSMAGVYAKAQVKFEEQTGKMRQLTIDFATRAYTLGHGHAPAAVSDLVPDYLKAMPEVTSAATNDVSAR